jgi:hypothetical protein
MKYAHYRKLNNGSLSSSTYHKKDGTAVRAILNATPRLKSAPTSTRRTLLLAALQPRL